MGLLLRLFGAIAAGAVLVVSVGVLHYGLGQGALGLVHEPEESFPPHRWPAIPDNRPARVLLLGTSLTRSGDWTQALQAQLSACRPGGVEIERLAKGGANSAWGEAALRDRLTKAALPDLIVAEFTINDASLVHGMTLGKSRVRHAAILDMAAAANIPVWLATMNPAFGRKALERPGQAAYRAQYPNLARAHGAGLVALVPDWLALDASYRAAALPDGLHPTDAAMMAVTVPVLAAALAVVLCPEG